MHVRNVNGLPDDLPLFTLQGGMNRVRLHGFDRWMINVFQCGLAARAQRTQDENRMLAALECGDNYVSKENLAAVLDLWKARK